VRDANMTQIGANAEIQNLKQILGLQHGKVRVAGCHCACMPSLAQSTLQSQCQCC